MLDDVSHYSAPPTIKKPGASPSHVSRDSDELNPIDTRLLGVLLREWLAAGGSVFKSGEAPELLKPLTDAAKMRLKQEIAEAASDLLALADDFFGKGGDETTAPCAKGHVLQRVGKTIINEFDLGAYLSATRSSAYHPLLKSREPRAPQIEAAFAPAT